MINASGILHKMHVEIGEPIQYKLHLGDTVIDMNSFVGKEINMSYSGEIRCIACGKKTRKSFGQGFCFPCFNSVPEAAECIIRPELCRGHLGEGRDVEWEQKYHVCEHIVYLALSSAVKVGVTKNSQIPIRWIDQGASAAIILAHTPNRYLAGCIEVQMKKHFVDKTNWIKMLKNVVLNYQDLVAIRNRAVALLPMELRQYGVADNEITQLDYPVLHYPSPELKIKSLNFDNSPEIHETLMGIKAQYLIFKEGKVINIRKFTGYVINFLLHNSD